MSQGNHIGVEFDGAPCHDFPGELTFVKNNETRVFTTGATRDADQTKLDPEGFLSPKVLRRYSEYMNEMRLRNVPPGETVRSSDNWQLGIPKDAYMKSMIRHVMEVWESHRHEYIRTAQREKAFQDTLCAVIFNAMGYLFEDMK